MGPVVQMAKAVDAEVHLLTVVEKPGMRSTWIEALALPDEGTGEFSMTLTPDMLPQSVEDAESMVQALAPAYSWRVPGLDRR